MSVPGPQEPKNRDRVQSDTVHAPVFHHARVPGGRRPAVAQRDFSADTATVRRQRDNHRLGTRVWLAVHAGGGQHTDGRQSDGAPDKRDTGKQSCKVYLNIYRYSNPFFFYMVLNTNIYFKYFYILY